MNPILEQMLSGKEGATLYDKKNGIKEVVQEVVLSGLSRGGFFKKAAFYGGTALRIFYGLDRFSEDLDFSLIEPDTDFDFSEYIPVLQREIASYGLNFKIETREKAVDSAVKSAFLKGNTREHLMFFYADERLARSIAPSEVIKIKFEVDTDPPPFAALEHKYRLRPSPYEITLYDEPSLFAGKIHAVLCRAWKNRVKGRDLYDYVFYLSRGAAVNLPHFEARLAQSGYIEPEAHVDLDTLKEMLCQRFEQIDFENAREDVLPFIRNADSLSVWGSEFFTQITKDLRAL